MTRQVAEAICLEHDTRADGTLDYAALCDDIFAGDFDHYAHQQHFVYKVWRRLLPCGVRGRVLGGAGESGSSFAPPPYY